MKYKTLKYALALLLICVLVAIVDVQELWAALSQLTLFLACYLILISILLVYVSALKWKIFVESYGKQASILHLFNLYLVGYFVNLLMPSYVGGDVVRSWYIGKRIGQHEAAASTILERYTGLVAMICLALVFMWGVESAPFEVKVVIVLIALGLLTVTVLALSPTALQLFGRIRRLKGILSHLVKIQEALVLAKGNFALLAKTFFLSFVFHSVTVVNVIAAAAAVGWYNPPVWDLFVVLPLILLIGIIPIAPSGLGLQEGAYLVFLQSIGASPSQALGVGLVLRAKSYVLAIWGGVIWLSMKREEGAAKKPG